MKKRGLVHLYCGKGKGKTTAACGLALRAAGQGKKVYLFFFFKRPTYSGEIKLLAKLKNLRLSCFKERHPFFIKKGKASYRTKLRPKLNKFLDEVKLTLGGREGSLVVLDEILEARAENLITERELIDLIKAKGPGVEVVLTGRLCPSKTVSMLADYMTEFKNLKHPYKKGINARRGIDF